MSLEIDWNRLLEDEDVISEAIRSFLDKEFQSLTLPPYIKSISVESLSLGTTTPQITIKNITDPFPEFYDFEEDDGKEDIQQPTGLGLNTNGRSAHEDDIMSTTSSLPSYSSEAREGHGVVQLEDDDDDDSDIEGYSNAEGSSHQESHNPTLPRSPDGTARLHYFPPLSSNLLSNFRSPLYASLQNLASLNSSQSPAAPPQNRQPGEPSINFPSAPAAPATSGRDDDIQFYLDIAYNGDMSLCVTAKLLLNYPSPSFVSLPLKLTLTQLEIHAMAVLAYISKRIHFSFICDIEDEGDSEILIGHERINIIKNIKIESEIGDVKEHGSVLRNVGKVERFLLERIRSLVRDELAWPGWITLEF